MDNFGVQSLLVNVNQTTILYVSISTKFSIEGLLYTLCGYITSVWISWICSLHYTELQSNFIDYLTKYSCMIFNINIIKTNFIINIFLHDEYVKNAIEKLSACSIICDLLQYVSRVKMELLSSVSKTIRVSFVGDWRDELHSRPMCVYPQSIGCVFRLRNIGYYFHLHMVNRPRRLRCIHEAWKLQIVNIITFICTWYKGMLKPTMEYTFSILCN
jgi:hypothetical protein